MKTAFIYSDRFGSVSYSREHPMKPARLKLTHGLISSLGLFDLPGASIVEAAHASDEDILLFHTPDYLKVLKEADNGVIPSNGHLHGLGYGDNPVFRGVFDWSRLCTGASVQAATLVAGGKADVAFNISGGLHHAMPDRASGFCYINDPAVAIKRLVSLGKRVAYIDIDAHHGDGVEHAFYGSRDVLAISLHESGRWLFPGTGFTADTGEGPGRGFSVNLPLPPGITDEEYLAAFNEVVPSFVEAFGPDIIVTQLGVDTFDTDPLTHLSLTTNGFEELIRAFRSWRLPWVALGGGGYNVSNVARAWTLAWAIMNNVEAPERIPDEFMLRNSGIFDGPALRDGKPAPCQLSVADLAQMKKDMAYLKGEVLPLVRRR